MKPIFSIKYLSTFEVQFTDEYKTADQRIWRFDFGDGVLFQWDSSDQTIVRHTYSKPGEYYARAIAVDRKTASDPVPILIVDSAQDSWWTRLIKWIKSILKR